MTVTKQLNAEIMSRQFKVKETNCSLSNILNLSYMLFNSPTAIYPDEECVIWMRSASENSKIAYTARLRCNLLKKLTRIPSPQETKLKSFRLDAFYYLHPLTTQDGTSPEKYQTVERRVHRDKRARPYAKYQELSVVKRLVRCQTRSRIYNLWQRGDEKTGNCQRACRKVFKD